MEGFGPFGGFITYNNELFDDNDDDGKFPDNFTLISEYQHTVAPTPTEPRDDSQPSRVAKMKSSRNENGERIHKKAKPRHIGPMEGHLIAAVGEFVGTFFFLWMAYSAQLMVINQASSASLIGGASSHTVVYISLIYGLSLLVNAWAFYRISGGLFNPAVRIISPPP